MDPIFLVITVVGVIVLLIFGAVVATFFRIWIRAFAAQTNVSFLRLVGMSLRKVNPGIMVDSRIMAVKAGLDVSWDELETHYLAGGNIQRVIQALIAASNARL